MFEIVDAIVRATAALENKAVGFINDEIAVELGINAKRFARIRRGHERDFRFSQYQLETLSRIGATRGMLQKLKIKQLLWAGRHPNPEAVLQKIYGDTQPLPSSRFAHNLPASPYTKFFMREEPFELVCKGINQRASVILIFSLGGMGKTSLAFEMASRCRDRDKDWSSFEALVWVSDDEPASKLTLSGVLDTIAHTLGFHGYTREGFDMKKTQVETLLRNQKVLLIVDNFETVADETLAIWLLKYLPEPSKALVTTREYGRVFQENFSRTYPVRLAGLGQEEMPQFIQQQLANLDLPLDVLNTDELMQIETITGGNPFAINLILGQVKFEQWTIQQILENLRDLQRFNVLFDRLFKRCWKLLNGSERDLLMALTMFPHHATEKALAWVANVHLELQEATQKLTDLSLINRQDSSKTDVTIFDLHPLVRLFASKKLSSPRSGLEMDMQDRWVEYYVTLSERVGACWDHVEKLPLLDPEKDNILEAIDWCFQQRRYEDVCRLAKETRYYFYVRGDWASRLIIDDLNIKAARHLSWPVEEITALNYYLMIVLRRHDVGEINGYLTRLRQLYAQHSHELTSGILSMYYQTEGLYKFAKEQYDQSINWWEKGYCSKDQRNVVSIKRWAAKCLYEQGAYEECNVYLQDGLPLVLQLEYVRSAALYYVDLAKTAIALGQLDDANQYLVECRNRNNQLKCPVVAAEMSLLCGRYYLLRGDHSTAYKMLAMAKRECKQTGLRRELLIVENELEKIDYEQVEE